MDDCQPVRVKVLDAYSYLQWNGQALFITDYKKDEVRNSSICFLFMSFIHFHTFIRFHTWLIFVGRKNGLFTFKNLTNYSITCHICVSYEKCRNNLELIRRWKQYNLRFFSFIILLLFIMFYILIIMFWSHTRIRRYPSHKHGMQEMERALSRDLR